ncbi:hypothetical protein RvY_08716 [Ramazzottius varieornatus]|uniref:C3H1-type domain-containing protein n=1 Tax=Ramazzottius varieornatus TaxID=947166 RepID=A0A1D1V930_RAMVA|nr:hypothetical protein RvY_08716 [Ramazzottius varieornatus]
MDDRAPFPFLKPPPPGSWPTSSEVTIEDVEGTPDRGPADHHNQKPWARKEVSRTGLEKSDSCYDSDDHEICVDEDTEYDADYGQILTPRNKHVYNASLDRGHGSAGQHQDVSRTVSDTLHAEYGDDTLPLDETIYKKHLAFALKLGYTELQVQKALKKLSGASSAALASVTENALLGELINLGATESFVGFAREPSSPSTTLSSSILSRRSSSTTQQPLRRVGSDATGLRHIVIDGSNVAMSHGNKAIFSCRGIALCVEYFQQRGHQEITVFVPQWRKEASTTETPIIDQEVLLQLERQGLLTFTPSRYVQHKRVVCYDDRYILKLALETDGIVVSNDNYRDLIREDIQYRQVVEQRLLMYSFVNDRFMPPDDPLGRHGPTLQQFLRKSSAGRQPLQLSLSNSSDTGGSTDSSTGHQAVRPTCPYGRKCTYGNKCKFAHPERGNLPQKSVTDMIGEQARMQLQEIKQRQLQQHGPGEKKKLTASMSSPSRPPSSTVSSDFIGGGAPGEERSTAPANVSHKAVSRTRSLAPSLDVRNQLLPPSDPMSAGDANWSSFAVSPGGDGLQAMTQNFSQMFSPGQNPRLPPTSNHSHWLSPRGSTANPFAASADQSQWHQPLRPTKSAGYVEYEGLQNPTSHSRQQQQQTQHNKLQRQLSVNPYASTSQQQTQHSSNFAEASSFFDDSGRQSMSARNELFSRLSALFPEEQVRIVMGSYPQETNAQKLCAAILATFPNSADDGSNYSH